MHFKNCDEHLLSIVASIIVELQDYGGTYAQPAAEVVCEEHPELKECYGQEFIEAVALSILSADVVNLSKRYTEHFSAFNASYFGGHLPQYEVRVVFDLHTVANEPVYRGSVSSGLIRFEERCIYIRYTDDSSMIETLVHEMAHAATSGDHDERWYKEMRRLQKAGAPVPDYEFEPDEFAK